MDEKSIEILEQVRKEYEKDNFPIVLNASIMVHVVMARGQQADFSVLLSVTFISVNSVNHSQMSTKKLFNTKELFSVTKSF